MDNRKIVERIIRKLDYKNRITLTPKMVAKAFAYEYEVTLYDDDTIVIKKIREEEKD